VYRGYITDIFNFFGDKVESLKEYELKLPRMLFGGGWSGEGRQSDPFTLDFYLQPFLGVRVDAPMFDFGNLANECYKKEQHAPKIVLEYQADKPKTFWGETIFIDSIRALIQRLTPQWFRHTYVLKEAIEAHLKKNNLPIPLKNIVCYP
jgi:hypothetical protein